MCILLYCVSSYWLTYTSFMRGSSGCKTDVFVVEFKHGRLIIAALKIGWGCYGEGFGVVWMKGLVLFGCFVC